MHILGISAYYHDSAAALLSGGMLVAAAQEERFTRVKNDHRLPERAIEFCLASAGITAADLDYVVFYEKPLPKFERILLSNLAAFPRSMRLFREAMTAWFSQKLWVKSQLMDRLRVPPSKLLFVDHHLSHAASAMFCSPFEEAAVVTVDGVGEWTTTAVGRATGDWDTGARNEVTLSEELRFPHSLGLLYSAFTAWLGFKVNSGEYKVMGMAPYGSPRYVEEVGRVVQVFEDGSFELDLDYFSFHRSLTKTYSDRFVELFGAPREPESEFFTAGTGADPADPATQANQHYADVAASIQRVTEDVLLKVVRHAKASTGLSDLVMAGGVALNSVANGRILREGPFDRVWIQPNAGDAGGALGAALYAWHVLLRKPRNQVMERADWGQAHSMDAVLDAVRSAGLPFEVIDDDEALCGAVARELADQKVVGLFRGRFEWGPRALGQRSIIADPRREQMREVVNRKIKFREPFRPFAPVIAREDAGRYLDLGPRPDTDLTRFMLMVCPVAPGRSGEIPAVSHMGTARPQVLVDNGADPVYAGILAAFGEQTGVPVLMNTSFNLRAEPIVNTPRQAVATFGESGLDVLVMDRCVARRP